MAKKAFPEKFKTLKAVFDLFTEKNLFKLISQGYFDGLLSPLSVGKESNVFIAKKGDEFRIVKIYRLSTCDFNRMYDYIKYDPRYVGLKSKRRKVIFAWANREFRNLLKAREAGVRVPTPFTVLSNILVMEFIGDDAPAPRLNKAPPKNPKTFANDIIKQMKNLHKAGIVHADLSAFNILNYNEKPVFIDMSQTTPLNDPRAEEYLDRDIKNMCTLFKKWKLKLSADSVKKQIIGK